MLSGIKKSKYFNRTFVYMNTTASITALFSRIPRRHNDENVKEIKNIVAEYEDVLIIIEAKNSFYEKNISPFFDVVEDIKTTIKKSTDNKASKKTKNNFFDEASVALKDSMEELLVLWGDGERVE
jgi:CRISPR/Cas system CSM-associated protein Csm2 small subunit